eukprot:comp19896_c0_seq1/m.24111 comp19896_c0_seq1/g.24111  ORF comp19896_c0_seq1/g.24111 comp19896_c0_seq1/m.24111 type:complete len:361 (-) comp19896_c0_seq1:356-1438(-)
MGSRVLTTLPSEEFTQVDLSPAQDVCHLCEKVAHNSSSSLIPVCRCVDCPFVRQQVHPVCLSKYRGMTSRMCPGECECQQRAEEQEGTHTSNVITWSPLSKIKDLVAASPTLSTESRGSELNTPRPPAVFEAGKCKARKDSEDTGLLTSREKARALFQQRRFGNGKVQTQSLPSSLTVSQSTFTTPVLLRSKALKSLKKRNSDPPKVSTPIVSAPPSPALSPCSSLSPELTRDVRTKRHSCSSLQVYSSAEIQEEFFPSSLSPKPLFDLTSEELIDLHEHMKALLERKSLRLVMLLQQQEGLTAQVDAKRTHAAQLCELFMTTTASSCRSNGSFMGVVFSHTLSSVAESQPRVHTGRMAS